MSHERIRSLLEQRLTTWATGKGLRVAYRNAPFTPGAGETYLRAFAIPSVTGSTDLPGNNRHFIGHFQINIIIPAGTGAGNAEKLASELAEVFPLFSEIAQAGFRVKIMTPVAMASGIQGDIDYTVPASFRYRSGNN